MFKGQTLLITGGTGSFGNAVLKRFLHTEIKEIRIFSRDEKKQSDMRLRLKTDKVQYYLGDVRDYESVDYAMRGVDYVFHAAALKQVPSCEFYPLEAVKTNILGTENVIEAAIRNRVKRAVFLSTDKAVYPINAMGLSKALMEKLMVARSRTLREGETILCGTRYGNVMASRGSVIPLFVEELQRGEPLSLTDPNMTRFMMSLDEAIELVLFAIQNGHQGDIFVQKSPAATIQDLAESLIELFEEQGKVLGLSRNSGKNRGYPIRIIGTRHGEKLYETLVTREELAVAEDCGAYYRIISDSRDLNYSKYYTEGAIEISIREDYNSHNARRLNKTELKQLLLELNYIQEELAIPRRRMVL